MLNIVESMIIEMAKKKVTRTGDCFDASFDFMVDNMMTHRYQNLKLVHGFVSGQGKVSGYRYAHGWCEDDDYVYDYSNNRELKIPKFLYYSIGNIVPEQNKYYNESEVRKMATKLKHKGPWEIDNSYHEEKY